MPPVIPPNGQLSPVVPGGVTNSAVAPVEAGVAPQPVEDVTVTTPPADSGNNVEFKDLPERAQKIIISAKSGDSIGATDEVNKHVSESVDYHPNMQPQVGKMIFSAIAGRWGDVYKYYNGGATREEEAKTPSGQIVYKVFNEVGPTGQYKDYKTGKLLSPTQTKALIDAGGVISASDERALKTSTWKNAITSSELANKGFASQVEAARTSAYAAANEASASNRNIEEQIGLAKRIPHVLDYVSQLPSERRQKLLGYISRFNTNSKALNQANEKGGAVNTGNAQNANARIGSGDTTPMGGNVGFGGSAQSGVSNRENNSVSNANSNVLQEQQNLERAIIQELQGVIKPGQQFNDFVRLQSLNAQNELAMKNIPSTAKPPGWQEVPETDPFTGGTEAMIKNRAIQQANNALMTAYSTEIFRAQRTAAKTGQQADIKEIQDKFANSDMFKAIRNTYTDRFNKHLGRGGSLKKGDLIVDQNHNIFEHD